MSPGGHWGGLNGHARTVATQEQIVQITIGPSAFVSAANVVRDTKNPVTKLRRFKASKLRRRDAGTHRIFLRRQDSRRRCAVGPGASGSLASREINANSVRTKLARKSRRGYRNSSRDGFRSISDVGLSRPWRARSGEAVRLEAQWRGGAAIERRGLVRQSERACLDSGRRSRSSRSQ